VEQVKVSALRWVPPAVQGLVRDLRVRWALEEVAIPYEERLLTRDDQKSETYRRLQPFGQVPALETSDVAIFESGAAVLHLAERSEALMPKEEALRAHVKTWMFAALNTIEPPIMMLNMIDFEKDKAPLESFRNHIVDFIGGRLDNLVNFLGNRDWLIGDRFTAADLLLVTVLRILRTTDLVEKRPSLLSYRRRGEARPAFQRALAAQLETFEKNAPPS